MFIKVKRSICNGRFPLGRALPKCHGGTSFCLLMQRIIITSSCFCHPSNHLMGSSAPWRSELIISPCVPVHWYPSVGHGPAHQNYALHGLIIPRDHSNVNHVSSLNLSNICMKSLAYHIRAQRYYTYLPYKVEETNRTTYWANIHKKRKVSIEDHSSHVHEVIWSRDVQS
jgi:hypothetical protein